MSCSNKLPTTKEELDTLIATVKAEAKAEAELKYGAVIEELKSTLSH